MRATNSAFATRLKEVMKARGTNQTWLVADIEKRYGIDIKRQTISQYLLGLSHPDTERLALLCKALDVSADYLLGLPSAKPSEYAGFTYENIQWLRALPDLAALNEIMGSEHFRTLVESLCLNRGKSK